MCVITGSSLRDLRHFSDFSLKRWAKLGCPSGAGSLDFLTKSVIPKIFCGVTYTSFVLDNGSSRTRLPVATKTAL